MFHFFETTNKRHLKMVNVKLLKMTRSYYPALSQNMSEIFVI